jgi:hypothetical protein
LPPPAKEEANTPAREKPLAPKPAEPSSTASPTSSGEK